MSTPPDSGRNSPALRPPRHQLEDEPRKHDKAYRRWAAGIDRALATFDPAHLEWPDYISFLGRLLKAIQGHPPGVDSLPHKVSIANRLAQSLRPSLPSGVHQKALGVYDYIFSLIGETGLADALPVYLPGLSAVLGFASLSLRPTFLSLFETHIITLNGRSLRPALRALILSLLPGLEEEGGEDFERTLQILDRLKDKVNVKIGSETSGDESLWQCFFLACISSASRRQGALAFLAKRLPILSSRGVAEYSEASIGPGDEHTLPPKESLSAAAESVVAPEPGLLVRCFVAGLEDEQILTQRGFLDLLLTHLPLDSLVLVHRAPFNDLVRLVGAATSVVGRRDMSLNRRLWSWFLGPNINEDSGEEQEELLTSESTRGSRAAVPSRPRAYFETYGERYLSKSVLSMLNRRSSDPIERARPFRICLSLMDRVEIGSAIIPHVFLPAITNIYEYKDAAPERDFQDVLRSASSFFDGIDSGTIWGQVAELAASAFSNEAGNKTTRLRTISLAEFVIMNFNVREEEMLAIHIPLLILLLLLLIGAEDTEIDNADRAGQADRNARTYSLVETLVAALPTGDAWSSPVFYNRDSMAKAQLGDRTELVGSILRFYTDGKGQSSQIDSHLPNVQIARLMLTESAELVVRALDIDLKPLSFGPRCRILMSLLSKIAMPPDTGLENVVMALRSAFDGLGSSDSDKHSEQPTMPFPNVNVVVMLLGSMVSASPNNSWRLGEAFAELCANLSRCLWDQLDPSSPKYHLEAVRSMWQLEELLPKDKSVEAAITSLLVRSITGSLESPPTIEQARRFAVLWNHTNPQLGGQSLRIHGTWSKSFAATNNNHIDQGSNLQEKLYRPLFVLLDAGDEGDSELKVFLDSWIEELPGASRIFNYLLTRLRSSYAQSTRRGGKDHEPSSQPRLDHQDQSAECVYFMRRLLSLLRRDSDQTWTALVAGDKGLVEGIVDSEDSKTILSDLAQLSFVIASSVVDKQLGNFSPNSRSLQQLAISVLQVILACPYSSTLQVYRLEERLVRLVREGLKSQTLTSSIQASLLDTTLIAVKSQDRKAGPGSRHGSHRRFSSMDYILGTQTNSTGGIAGRDDPLDPNFCSELVKCLQDGFESSASVHVLEHWVRFFINILPLLADTLFQNIIPLVETLCRRIRNIFEDLCAGFETETQATRGSGSPEPGLVALLNGLEYLLDAAHERMMSEESKRAPQRTPEPQQGFFGNVVSGVFAGEAAKSRPSGANARLAVILCFQDALRVCLSIWSWGAYGGKPKPQDPHCLASFAYVSQRLRSRTRRFLDGMFTAEGLECLEALVVTWVEEQHVNGGEGKPTVINLLHVLDASTPKQTMPALFNSMYSRTSPASLDASRMSTLTSDITDTDLAHFLLEYTKSLDDDAMDEIWTDCMTFSRDVLLNPLPHNHVLPSLLEFLIVLAQKVDKTNFGDQRKMKRELAETFLRLLTATFTTRITTQPDTQQMDEEEAANSGGPKGRLNRRRTRQSDLTAVLLTIVPKLPTVLADNDRLLTAVTNISTNYITPLLQSKSCPQNLQSEQLTVWQHLTSIPSASKIWRKDLTDLFMHPKLFSVDPTLAIESFAPLMRRLASYEKERVTELLGRINSPTSAGIMFGVGATAARTDSDKKTQLLLRRASYIILCAEEDYAVTSVSAVEEKMSELLNATPASSPSSATRAEIFMLISALVLSTSQIHLVSLWPLVTSELQRAISSAVTRSADFETYNVPSILQACKLLDLLLVASPDEFQLHEWLFITDTIEAVYRPGHWEPVALLDDLADELGAGAEPTTPGTIGTPGAEESPFGNSIRARQPLLQTTGEVAGMGKEAFVGKVLRPFFAQLSMHAYEVTYAMRPPDLSGCRMRLMKDLFDVSTIIG